MSAQIIIIAGPNGAGKTTFARQYLPREAACTTFINVDLIAAGLSPFDPDASAIQAGRVMLAEMRRYVEGGQSFAFETTLSGRSYAQQILRSADPTLSRSQRGEREDFTSRWSSLNCPPSGWLRPASEVGQRKEDIM